MDEIDNWYWNFGIKRGYDPSDPDRETRKVPIGGWLDPVEQILRRDATIRANASGRACIALWGPSQTGKSTLLSRYIDGEKADGTDSAMTWDETRPVRFSSPFQQEVPPETVVFNPYHFGSDASGVATRYTLGRDGEVDPAYPVEMRLASRVQVVNALSLGYFADCQPVGESIEFTQDSFLELVAPKGESDVAPTREGYAVLCDVADVIYAMRGKPRFYHLFGKSGDWQNKIRPALVSAPGYVSDPDAARAFMEEVFWESAAPISKVCRETLELRARLDSLWGDRRVYLSQEAAALMLDIDTFRCFVEPNGNLAATIAEKVRRLRWAIDGKRVLVAVDALSGSPEISGARFGSFQALCGELVVPLRASRLEGDAKAPFRSLIEKCDILDLPGLSNINPGDTHGGENSAQLDLSKTDEALILTRVFKEGKTQSLVHGQAMGYGLDAFIILSRADRAPSKTSLINEGIGEWLTSFDPEWRPGQPCGMPVFLDLTFFAGILNTMAANVGGQDLSHVVKRVQDYLTFTAPGACRWFTTTYPHIRPDGFIHDPELKDSILGAIAQDKTFLPQTEMTREDVEAVYAADGGTGQMLRKIAAAVSPAIRAMKCQKILAADKERLVELLKRQLPGGPGEEDATRQRLAHFREEAERRIKEAEQSEDFENCYLDLAHVFKTIFSATPETFEPVPMGFGGYPKKKAVDYVRRQAVRWFDAKSAVCRGIGGFADEDVLALLSALRDSLDAVACAKILHGPGFGALPDGATAQMARFPLAMLFTNLLLHGRTFLDGADETDEEARPERVLDRFLTSAVRGDANRSASPAYCRVVGPAMRRVEQIEKAFKSRGRPPQIGDDELKALLARISPEAQV